MPGVLIALEAGEGAGKTTLVPRLAERLRSQGHEVVTTREPGGCPAAEAIRNIVVKGAPGDLSPVSELLLFAAARVEHMRQTIQPALDRGAVVLTDRFCGSTFAMQGSTSPELAVLARDLHARTVGRMPDLTILLDIPADVGLARSTKRLAAQVSNEHRFEDKGLDYHRRINLAFRNLARVEGWAIVDAQQPMDVVLEQAAAAALAVLTPDPISSSPSMEMSP